MKRTGVDHTTLSSANTTHSPHTVELSQDGETPFQGHVQCVPLFFLQDSNQSHHNPSNHHQAAIAGSDNEVTGKYAATIAGDNNNATGPWSALIAGEKTIRLAVAQQLLVDRVRRTQLIIRYSCNQS